MPQGEAKAADGAVPEKTEYARKAKNVKRGGPTNKISNPNYAAALGNMTRNIELLAAGRLMQAGSRIHMKDVRELGVEEMKQKAGEKRKRNAVTEVLEKGRNVKGVRGEFDADALADLAPELKALLDHRKVSSGKGKAASTVVNPPPDEAEPEAIVAPTGSLMPAPSAASKAKGKGKAKSGGGPKVASLAAAGGGGGGASGLFATDAEVAKTFGSDFM